MTVIRTDEPTPIETPGLGATIAVATPSRGATEVSVIRQRQYPGGFNPPHRHDREEVMVVQAGTVALVVGGVDHLLRAGDAAIVPAETIHQVRNAGDQPAEWLIVAPVARRFFHVDGQEAHPEWAQ